MSGGACKTIICFNNRNLEDFKEKDFRKVFQNPEIANAVENDLENQGRIWEIGENPSKKIGKKDRQYLRECLKGYTE